MANGLARYEFSERLAEILGESRRDLRFRVTLMVSSGLVAPGPRGRGSPPTTARYAADLLIGAMAAPQQADTVEAIRCYRALLPADVAADPPVPRVIVGPPAGQDQARGLPTLPLLSESLTFGDALARLLEMAREDDSRELLARDLFGVWVGRGYPVSAVQLAVWREGRRTVVTQRYELPPAASPPPWLDPTRGGVADPGLLHTVFLPARKLIAIGRLTTLPDLRSTPMLKKLGPKMAALAELARRAGKKNPNQRRWEKLLAALAAVEAWSNQIDGEENRLDEVTGFGSNPGELRMFTYVPDRLPPSAPLVVLLHGCTQSAAAYNKGGGWSTLADRHGFALLLPQQGWKNNPLRCFNWFRPEDSTRDRGEARSIVEMVERMCADFAIDRRRVYVTGLSSGGAMTAVMLATYPEVFAGGAILAGVPYRSASNLQEAFDSMFQGRGRSASDWGELVRAASPHRGPWPKVSVWHGDADTSVKPVNADEIVKQWTNVHALAATPTLTTTVDGHRRRVWQGRGGDDLIESYTVTGMAHGAPLSPGEGPTQCGTAAPFFNDVGISSTYHITSFWGLATAQPPASASARARTAPPSGQPRDSEVLRADDIKAGGTNPPAGASPADETAANAASREPRGEPPAVGAGIQGIINRSLEAAGLSGARKSSSRSTMGTGGLLGIDVHGIIASSLEAAGLPTGARSGAGSPTRSSAPLGIDVPAIISTALTAAGLLKGAGSDAPGDRHAYDGLARSGWEGDGWNLLINDPRTFHGGPLLYGHVSSGVGSGLGQKVHAISRQWSLGRRPELSYVRRLTLSAAVNDYTRASFRVLVDGVPVDEVSAVGMVHAETQWLRRSGIDLARFANKTVTLTLEVAALSNVCNEVFAKAWVDQITVHDAVELAQP